MKRARTVLAVGGAGSGKSAYAEVLILRLSEARNEPDGEAGKRPLIYLATMRPFGDEAAARIEKHRAQRAGRGFATVERFADLEHLNVPRGSAVLLEDIGNLCANEMFDPDGAGDGAGDAIVRGVERLREQCAALVIVSNETGAGGENYAGDTARYLRVLGTVNQRLAALADGVCEVVCGIPDYYKGEEPR